MKVTNYIYCYYRDSVVFKDDQKYKDVGLMTGIDITSPPTIPRPFLVKKEGASDIVVASEDNSDEEEESADDDEDDELNTARFDENDNDEKSKENNPVSDVGDC